METAASTDNDDDHNDDDDDDDGKRSTWSFGSYLQSRLEADTGSRSYRQPETTFWLIYSNRITQQQQRWSGLGKWVTHRTPPVVVG